MRIFNKKLIAQWSDGSTGCCCHVDEDFCNHNPDHGIHEIVQIDELRKNYNSLESRIKRFLKNRKYHGY